MASKRSKGKKSAAKSAAAKRGRGASSASRSSDVLRILKEDHQKVKALFDKFEKMRGGNPRRTEIVERACQELTVHALLEEEIFYPAVHGQIRQADLVDEAEVEHQSAKTLIQQLQEMDPSDAKYSATFKVLAEYVKHHVKEEENELFPQVRKTRIDLKGLGEQLQMRRQELLSSDLPAASRRAQQQEARGAEEAQESITVERPPFEESMGHAGARH